MRGVYVFGLWEELTARVPPQNAFLLICKIGAQGPGDFKNYLIEPTVFREKLKKCRVLGILTLKRVQYSLKEHILPPYLHL